MEQKKLKTGDVYNPYRIFVGLFIPNCIAESTKLSQSAKLCLGRLFQYAGKNKKCYPKQKTLAKAIGVSSIKQVQRCLKELEDNQLIKITKAEGYKKLQHYPDTYEFLWNEEFFFENDEDEEENEEDTHGGDKNVPSENDKDTTNTTDQSWDKNAASEGDKNVASNGNRIRNKVGSEIKPNGFSNRSANSRTSTSPSKDKSQTPERLDDRPDEKPKKVNPLRDRKKITTANKQRKARIQKSYKIPKINEQYWEILKNSKFKCPGENTKTFRKIDRLITELRLGKYDYCNDDRYKHLIGRKITPDDFQRFIDNFTLAAFSYEHEPKDNPGMKKTFQSWYFTYMLQNKSGFSAFATYLDNTPKRIDSEENDPHPSKTNKIIEVFNKELEWDLNNGNRKFAIKAVDKLEDFFETHKDKIQLYDIHYNRFPQQVKTLVEMMSKNDSPDYPMKPFYICSDLTYNKFLPKYLKDIGSM